jgi:hypothetical protein
MRRSVCGMENCNQRDEKNPGMRVSEAMTRQRLHRLSASWATSAGVCRSSIVPSACRHFVDWKRREAPVMGHWRSIKQALTFT